MSGAFMMRSRDSISTTQAKIVMKQIGKILVHFDDSANSEQRLALARNVAQIQVKEGGLPSLLEVVYVTLPDYLAAYSAFSAFSAGSFNILLEEDTQRSQEARARFDRWVKSPGPKANWISTINEMPHNFLLNRAWFCDLIVLGQDNPADPSASKTPRDLITNLIVDSGKPCLIVPYIETGKSRLQNVIVAWNNTRESSAALTAAIPFLQNASSIHVVADIPFTKLDEFSLQFESHLTANGVTVKPTFRCNTETELVGDYLLSIAADNGADLLVMGCYGHSRAREFILGGVSRTILRTMTLPVLMVH
jgi:nucleotide-binding universal stress UspA family protein